MSKSYSCWGCDFHDAVGDYCFREEKDHHFIRACDWGKVRSWHECQYDPSRWEPASPSALKEQVSK